MHQLYRPLLRSGLAFGARRWLATLQRQCECLAILMSSATVTANDSTGTGNSEPLLAIFHLKRAQFAESTVRKFCMEFISVDVIQTGQTERISPLFE